MRKADRLSKKYFRICSWNCANANRRGDALEKMLYSFDMVCLQKNKDKSTTSAPRRHSHSEALRSRYGNSSSERSQQNS